MANGVQVRTLDELKENWDLEKVLNYYLNGKLQTWLTDRYYTELADEVAALNGINDNTELQHKLCAIFGIAMEEDLVDVEAVAERNRRLEILRQYTADDAVLKNVDKVAFNQEELADLLDEDESVIYLCDNKFSIPLSVRNKTYIGVGSVEVVINSKEYVDFSKLGIVFENVDFNEEYNKLAVSDKILYEKGQELEAAEKYAEALEMYKKAGEMGNADGLFRTGKFYHEGRTGVEVNYELARKYYERAVELNNGKAMNNLANMYIDSKGVTKNISKAIELYKKAADLGNVNAMYNLGNHYYNGDVVQQDYIAAKNWYEKAANLNYIDACVKMGDIYYNGKVVDKNYQEAFKWYKASEDSAYSSYSLGWMYEFGQGTDIDVKQALNYYRKAAKSGYYDKNYIYDPTYRCAYKLFHEYKEYDKAVDTMKKYYNTEKIKCFVKAICNDISELDFPYNSLKTGGSWFAPQTEVMQGSSEREAFNELQNKIQERRNEVYSDYQQSISSAINQYFENINIMIRKVTFAKYLIEKTEFNIELDNNLSNSIRSALASAQMPVVYTSNYYVSYKSENMGSFFSPCYTYNLSYNGDIYQLEKEFINNISNNISSINNQIKNLFITEMKDLLAKLQ